MGTLSPGAAIYAEYAKGLGSKSFKDADALASYLASFLASKLELTQNERVTIEVVLPGTSTKAAVTICAYRRGPGSAPVALHLCNGSLKIGDTILTEDNLTDLLDLIDPEAGPDTSVANYDPTKTQVLGQVNGQAVYIDVDTSTCSGAGGSILGSASGGDGMDMAPDLDEAGDGELGGVI